MELRDNLRLLVTMAIAFGIAVAMSSCSGTRAASYCMSERFVGYR